MAIHQSVIPSQLISAETVIEAPTTSGVKRTELTLTREDWPETAVVTVRIERMTPAAKGEWAHATVTFPGGELLDGGMPRLTETIAVSSGSKVRAGAVRVRITPSEPINTALTWSVDDGADLIGSRL